MQILAIPIPSVAFGYPLDWALLRAVVAAALEADEDRDEKDESEDAKAAVMVVVVVITVLKFERMLVFEGEA